MNSDFHTNGMQKKARAVIPFERALKLLAWLYKEVSCMASKKRFDATRMMPEVMTAPGGSTFGSGP